MIQGGTRFVRSGTEWYGVVRGGKGRYGLIRCGAWYYGVIGSSME